MTLTEIVVVFVAIVVGAVGFALIRTLTQLRNTLLRLDETLVETKQVLGRAERILAQVETQVDSLSRLTSGFAQNASNLGGAAHVFGESVLRPLGIVAGILSGVSAALGLFGKRSHTS